jgi:hypothetical protein
MKNTISLLCLLFLVISSLSAQHAPWEKTAGPPGSTVKVVYKADTIVYAGTETQGVYRSTDDGLSWIAANNGIERASVADIVTSGGNLLVAAASRANECPALNNVFKYPLIMGLRGLRPAVWEAKYRGHLRSKTVPSTRPLLFLPVAVVFRDQPITEIRGKRYRHPSRIEAKQLSAITPSSWLRTISFGDQRMTEPAGML